MKKVLLVIFLVLILFNTMSGKTYKMKQFPYYAGVNANLFRLSGNDAPGSLARFKFGGFIGYHYTPYFAIEAGGGYATARPSDDEASGFSAWTTVSPDYETKTTFYEYNLGLKYVLLPDHTTTPYIKVGLGNLMWSCKNDAGSSQETELANGDNLYAFFAAGIENKLTERVIVNLNFSHSRLFGDKYNILGDGESPYYSTQIGVELAVKLGRGKIEIVNLEEIDAVTFQFNSIKITNESKPIILYVVEAMKQNPDLVLEVRGFTDNTGSDAVNMSISRKRAMSVKQMLVDRGIAPTRIITTAMGHQNPVATNSTAEGRALNRRVEFIELEK